MARKIEWIVVHHNGVAGRTIENVRRTHKGKGWSDIGYHFVIHEDCSVHAGRPLSRSGAHARGFNARSIGVCVIGNGNRHDFGVGQYVALEALVQGLMAVHKIKPDHVIGHREVNDHVGPKYQTRKVCPGRLVDLDELRRSLAHA